MKNQKAKKHEFVYTVKMFMEDYEGFDWEHGTIVIVEGNRPKMFQKDDAWYILYMEKYESKHLLDWACNENVMVMTVE